MFNAISGDRYLNHLTENVLAELPRQPAGLLERRLQIGQRVGSTVAFALDPLAARA